MAEEILENQEENVNQYLETIKQLKANSVSMTQYNKLKQENSELLNAILNGEQCEVPAVKQRSYEEIGKELANLDWTTNKDFFALSEEFREAMIEQRGIDPWTYCGEHNSPTDEMIDTANAVEKFMEEMHKFDDCDYRTYNAQIDNRIPKASGIMSIKK